MRYVAGKHHGRRRCTNLLVFPFEKRQSDEPNGHWKTAAVADAKKQSATGNERNGDNIVTNARSGLQAKVVLNSSEYTLGHNIK
jgi:hypothetical protein